MLELISSGEISNEVLEAQKLEDGFYEDFQKIFEESEPLADEVHEDHTKRICKLFDNLVVENQKL
jgi:hypothetical protein